MVARINGIWRPDSAPNPYGTGRIERSTFSGSTLEEITYLTSGFEAEEPWRVNPPPAGFGLGPHPGSDFNRYPDEGGDTVETPNRVWVAWKGWDPKGGNFVLMSLGDVDGVTEVVSYAHLMEPSPLQPYHIYPAGVPAGRIGTTGSASSGNHLHVNRRTGPTGGQNKRADLTEIIGLAPKPGRLPGEGEIPVPKLNLNELYLWATDAEHEVYDTRWRSDWNEVEPDEGWDQQVVMRRRRE